MSNADALGTCHFDSRDERGINCGRNLVVSLLRPKEFSSGLRRGRNDRRKGLFTIPSMQNVQGNCKKSNHRIWNSDNPVKSRLSGEDRNPDVCKGSKILDPGLRRDDE